MTSPIQRNYPSENLAGSHRKIKPWVLYAGGAAVVLGVYVFIIRPRSQAASTATSDTSTTDPNAVDSSLGYADSGGYDGGYGSYPTSAGYYDPSTGEFIGVGTPGGTVVTAPSTNAEWVQAAAALLISQGFNPVAVYDALGRYVTSTTSVAVTTNQMHIIESAIGVEGYPPVKPPDPHVASKPSAGGGTTPRATHIVTLQHPGTFHEVATRHNMSSVGLARLNPGLAAKYMNTGKKIPAGTRIRVYSEHR